MNDRLIKRARVLYRAGLTCAANSSTLPS